jgi:hypothetical protein
MKKILLLVGLLFSFSAQAFPFVAGQPLTAAQLNLAFSNSQITSGTIQGVSINATPIGSITPSTGAFTTLSATGAVSGVGFSNYLASPPSIGATTPSTGAFTTLSASGQLTALRLVAYGAGAITTNSANGSAALNRNTTGGVNTPNGGVALYSNTTGNNNNASGYSTLQSNTTGYNNSADGSYALQFNTTGIYNTANGSAALWHNTTGDYNTACGSFALQSNVMGNGNTAFGFSAGRYETGSNAFYVNNVDQATTAGDKAYSLLYGTFSGVAGSTAGQSLTVNGNFSATGAVSGVGFNNYLASPPAIGATTPAAISATTLSASGAVTVPNATAATQAVALGQVLPLSRMTSSRVTTTVAQAIAAATSTKVQFNTVGYDDLTEFNTATSQWTVQAAGTYFAGARILGSQTVATQRVLYVYVNGAIQQTIADEFANAGSSIIGGIVQVRLNAGDVVAIYYYSGLADTLNTISSLTFATLERIK